MPDYSQFPDVRGHFGPYGGMFVAETLMQPLEELRQAYEKYLKDPTFLAELDADLKHYVGRPSPLYFTERWSREQLLAAVEEGETQSVFLREPVPVAVLYWTVRVEEDGEIRFRRDPYGRDPAVLEALDEEFHFHHAL